MNENLYTEKQLNVIMSEHDKEWFELLHKTQKRYSILLGILLGFIFGFIGIVYYTYKITPPVKSQIIITDINGNVQDVQQIEGGK